MIIPWSYVIPRRIDNCAGEGLIVLIGNNINSIERKERIADYQRQYREANRERIADYQSDVKVGDDFAKDATKAALEGQAGKNNLLDMIRKEKGLPVLGGQDIGKILEIGQQAEKLPLHSRARMEMEQKALQVVADKLSTSLADKISNWRYMAMLTNPRTHIRNIVGNLMFGGVTRGKNVVATGIEAAANAVSRGGIERSKAVLNPASRRDRALQRGAKMDFENNYAQIMGTGKFNPARQIEDLKRIFKNPGLEKIRKVNNFALDQEDALQMRNNYTSFLAGYLKANGKDSSIYDAEAGTPDGDLLARGRAYATQEALRSVFRDASKLANIISDASYKLRSSGTVGGQLGSVLIEGALPFKKTPINIAKRGVEYSPLGIANGIKTAIWDVKNGTKTPVQAIDQIASGLTGTGIMGLGMYLFAKGVLTVGDDEDDKKAAFDRLTGGQSYALNIGGKSYTLDWAAPAALPLFIGAEFERLRQSGNQGGMDALIDSVTRLMNPMLEMTMLQGLNDAIKSAQYGQGSEISSIAINTGLNYITQFVPTALGQTARTIDPMRRSTYTENTGLTGTLERTGRQVLNKLPGLSTLNEPYVDLWGRTQENAGGNAVGRAISNMLSPGFASQDRTTSVDKELGRLYDALGESSVLPATADKVIEIEGNKQRYTAKQYTQYATALGQTRFDLLDELFETESYKTMDDTEKADLIGDVYSFSRAAARKEVEPQYAIPQTVEKMYQAFEYGISPVDYLLYRTSADADGNGSISMDEAQRALNKTELSREDKAWLFSLQNSAWKSNPYQ